MKNVKLTSLNCSPTNVGDNVSAMMYLSQDLKYWCFHSGISDIYGWNKRSVSQDLFIQKLSRIYQALSKVLLNILPSEYFGVLMSTRLDTSVENPGAKHDCAMKPSFSSLRQTAWSSRLQSHPGMFSNKPLLWYCISWRMTLVSSQ